MESVIIIAAICVGIVVLKKSKFILRKKEVEVKKEPTIHDERTAYLRDAFQKWEEKLFSPDDIESIKRAFIKGERKISLVRSFVQNIAIREGMEDVMKMTAWSSAEKILKDLGIQGYEVNVEVVSALEILRIEIKFNE